MNRWIGFCVIVAGLGAGIYGAVPAALAGETAPPPTVPSTQSIRTMSCDALIDQFVNISTKDYGVQTNILNTPGNPTENQKELLPLGPRQVKPSEAMEELVTRGFDSIGPLVRHIDDVRPTHFTITKGRMMVMSVDNEYDYNARTTVELAGVNLGEHIQKTGHFPEDITSHVLTVGDVCFKVLGQIVGREYDPIRYQPTACLIVSSPTNARALAKAVRDEWGTLTREQHKQKLLQDLLQPDSLGRETLAIETLARYYPEAAEDAILRRLQLPVYDDQPVTDLCWDFEKLSAQQRRKACEQFVKEHDPMYRDALFAHISGMGSDLWSKMFADAFPGYNPDKRYYVDIHTLGDLWQLIDALTYAQLHTPRLDAYMYGLYQQTIKESDPERGEGAAISCIDYLAGRGHDAEFLAYCQRRLKVAEQKATLEETIKKLTSMKAAPTTEPAGVP